MFDIQYAMLGPEMSVQWILIFVRNTTHGARNRLLLEVARLNVSSAVGVIFENTSTLFATELRPVRTH